MGELFPRTHQGPLRLGPNAGRGAKTRANAAKPRNEVGYGG